MVENAAIFRVEELTVVYDDKNELEEEETIIETVSYNSVLNIYCFMLYWDQSR